MKEWTPRERVLTAIKHKEPDRIPISFGGAGATGILECPPDGKSYSRLCKFLHIDDFQEPNIGAVFNFVRNIEIYLSV